MSRVTLAVKVPPPKRSVFANDQLLYLADMVSMTKSSTRNSRVVTVTRQSLFICKDDSSVKRTVPIEAILELTVTEDELLIHIPPHSDVLLKNDGKKAEQEELIGILEFLYKFHHGEGPPGLKINFLSDTDLQIKAKLPETESVDVKSVLDEMIKNVKLNQVVKQNLPPPPPDRSEEIQGERTFLEENVRELKAIEATVEEVSRRVGVIRSTREAQVHGLKMERDAISRDCDEVKDELQRLEITIMPALRHKKNVAEGTSVVTTALMEELLRVQKGVANERAQRDADASESLREMKDNYDAILLRKQDEIDLLEQQLFAAQSLNETLQLAVDNVVRTTTHGVVTSPSPPGARTPSVTSVTSQRPSPIAQFPQLRSQRDYFLRKIV